MLQRPITTYFSSNKFYWASFSLCGKCEDNSSITLHTQKKRNKKRLIEYPTDEQITAILRACEPQSTLYNLTLLLGLLGLRIGEALALTYADISKPGIISINKTLRADTMRIDTTKNKQIRFLTLPSELSHLVALSDSNDIIISNDKRHYHYNTIIKQFKTLQWRVLGEYYSPHCFRHAAAVRWLSLHKIEIVSRRLGHDSIETTIKHYSHFERFDNEVESFIVQ